MDIYRPRDRANELNEYPPSAFRGMGISPMIEVIREFDRYPDRIIKSDAFLADPSKIASLLLA